jgi:hypothetical protein
MIRALQHLRKQYVAFRIANFEILTSSLKVDAYYVPPTPLPPQPGSTTGIEVDMLQGAVADTTAGSPVKPKGFAMSFIQAAVRGRVESERAGCYPHQELLDYISSPLDPSVNDLILWWGVNAV